MLARLLSTVSRDLIRSIAIACHPRLVLSGEGLGILPPQAAGLHQMPLRILEFRIIEQTFDLIQWVIVVSGIDP